MNEISHEQALSLMQSEADGLLDEGGFARQEWANLHAHLETCPTCRAEDRRLRTLQRELHGALRAGLDAHEPPPVSVQPVIEARAANENNKRRLTRTVLIAPLALLLIMLSIWLRPDQLAVALLDPWGTAAKEFYASFDGQIVFESRRGGDLDLYLLQGGLHPLNLTQNPADDSDPVWSPDGAWVAFLSDRAADPLNARAIEPREQWVGRNMLFPTTTPQAGQAVSPGKREVFVLAPGADPAPIQVSAEPGVAWLAPLAWSADGKQLAAGGQILPAGQEIANTDADSWVYLIGLDGVPVTRLPNTRGAGQVRLSPTGHWLGYLSQRSLQQNFIFRQLDKTPAEYSSLISVMPTNEGEYRPGAGFAWSPGSSELAYIVEGPFLNRGGSYQPSNRAVSQLRRVVGFPGRMELTPEGRPLVELPLVDGLRDVAWSPDGTSLVMLQGTEQDPCWSLLAGRMPQVAGTEMEIFPVEGVCAEGKLTSRPWTPDGRWLVFSGRWHSGDAAIYALDLQQAIEYPNWAPLVARLTDSNGLDRLPQVQPAFPNLSLNPQAAKAAAPRRPLTADELAAAPGQLALNVNAGMTGMDMLALSPNGGQPVVVSALPGMEDSPVWSPTSRQIALVGTSFTSNSAAGQHLYVGAVPGPTATRGPQAAGGPQVASGPPVLNDLTPDGMTRIFTPSWSPDEQYLTAVTLAGSISANPNTALAIFAADGDPYDTLFIPAGGARFLGPSAWSPVNAVGERRIAALVSGRPFDSLTNYTLALALVDLSIIAQERVVITYQSVDGIDPNQVRGLAWEPNGRRIAVLAEVEVGGMIYPKVAVFRANAESDPLVSRTQWFADLTQSFVLPSAARGQTVRDDGLRWRPGSDDLSLVVNETERGKVVIYPAAGGPAQVLLNWDEPIYQHAWSPEGAWLAFSAESGVWLVNLAAYQQGGAPYRLISQGGWGLDWGE